MLGLLLDIQFASCVLPCGLGNRRVGSEADRPGASAVVVCVVAEGESVEVEGGGAGREFEGLLRRASKVSRRRSCVSCCSITK